MVVADPQPLSAIVRRQLRAAVGAFLFVYLVMPPNGDRSLRAAVMGAVAVLLLSVIETFRLWGKQRNEASDARLRRTRFAIRRRALSRAGHP